MNTNTTLSNGSWIQLNERRAARTAMLLLLLLLTLPAVVQAQFTYTTNNGAITITGYAGYGGQVTIPSAINGLSVTRIGDNAFYNCTWLTSVTIPDSVTNIGIQAFYGCHGLASVKLGNSLISIGDYAFIICTSLTNVTIPNHVTSIGVAAFYFCTSLNNITFPNSLTRIENGAFSECGNLTNITIPDSVTNIGFQAFYLCRSLASVNIPAKVATIGAQAFEGTSLSAITVDPNNPAYSSVAGVLFNKSQTTLVEYPGHKAGSYAIPNGVTSIESNAFGFAVSLTSVTIPSSVTRMEDGAFHGCPSLAAVHFNGNAPSLGGSSVFSGDNNATVYYLPGTTGWVTTFGGRPTMLWNPPVIKAAPQTQTAEARSAVSLGVEVGGASPLFCVWYLNSTNLISCSTNRGLNLTDVQLSQSGAYTVVISNVFGAVTSAPAILNVIAAVERRPVPGVKVMGEAGGLLNVDYADSLSPAPNWTTLGSVSLTGTSQYYFDLSLPLPPQRFYRAWQTGTPGVRPSLDLHLVPTITLTGNIGNSLRLDYINQFGPIDAWVTLDTVVLTNTSQLYFDVSAFRQPTRLYRLVVVP